MAGQRRGEERAGLLLGHQDVAVARREFRDEFIALRRDAHDRRDFLREPAAVIGALGRDMRIEHGPVALAEQREQGLDRTDGVPAD